ncbi:hypothetical protein KI387_041537, partial [Taxus chinensis]
KFGVVMVKEGIDVDLEQVVEVNGIGVMIMDMIDVDVGIGVKGVISTMSMIEVDDKVDEI